MRRLMDFTFDHFAAHPDLIHLINNENLLRAHYVRQSKEIAALTSPSSRSFWPVFTIANHAWSAAARLPIP